MELLTAKNLEQSKVIGIFGHTGSGKTALAFRILENIKVYLGKPVFVIKHPKPQLLEKLGYDWIDSIERINNLQDCVVYWDEPQLDIDMSEQARDRLLARIMSLARQRDIHLILSTSDTRLFSPRVESYISLWLVKACDYDKVKQRSKIQQILKRWGYWGSKSLEIAQNQYLSEGLFKNIKLNGAHRFNLINAWTEELSKPYRLDKETLKDYVDGAEFVQKEMFEDVRDIAKQHVEAASLHGDTPSEAAVSNLSGAAFTQEIVKNSKTAPQTEQFSAYHVEKDKPAAGCFVNLEDIENLSLNSRIGYKEGKNDI